jgi:hypothetical protein
MPQESTSDRAKLVTAQQLSFVQHYDDVADGQIADFDALVLRLRINMNEAKAQRSEQMLITAIATFLLAVDHLLTQQTTQLAEITTRFLAVNWPIFTGQPVLDTTELRLVSEQVRRIISERQQHLEVEAQQTGLSIVDLAPQEIMLPGEVNAVRKALDAANSRAVQSLVFTWGQNHILHKIAVPTIDDRTTRLCRRMAYQVQSWNQPFVDPETSAMWQYPPFVGGGLPPDESYHACRTVMLPLGD